jgi:hypothetical protein
MHNALEKQVPEGKIAERVHPKYRNDRGKDRGVGYQDLVGAKLTSAENLFV